MKNSMKPGVLVGVALLAAALVGVTVAEEPPKDTLQSSWNDYPAKWIGNSEIPRTGWQPGDNSASLGNPNEGDDGPGYPDIPDESDDPDFRIPEVPEGYPPITRRPRPPQQQQGKPSGGGFTWGGGKTGGSGSFGGKQGGSFNWGKTKPPQSQQGPRPGGRQPNANEAQLLQYIQQLQKQNAALRELLQRLAGQQGMNDGRSPNMPNGGVPLQ